METVTVSSFVEKLGITATFKYIGFDCMNETDKKEMDHWKVEFTFNPKSGAKAHKMTVDYWTGIGHRKRRVPGSTPIRYENYKMPYGRITLYDEEQAKTYKPFAPEIDSVLDCLISDAQSFEDTPHLEEWAENFGYDVDSRSAEKIFNNVSHQTMRLKTFLGSYYQEALNTERL